MAIMSDSTKHYIEHMLSPLTRNIMHYFNGAVIVITAADISFDRNMSIQNLRVYKFDNKNTPRLEEFCLDTLNFAVVSDNGLTGVIYRNHQHELKLSKYRGNDGIKLKKALIENLELLSKHTYSSINDMITMVLL